MRNPWNLSPRQVQTLQMAAAGLTSKEIGRELGLSHKTVDVHFDRLMETMQARNRLHAVLLWDRLNEQREPAPPHGTYLSGPMTGLPDLNFPAFVRAAAMLRAAGHHVVSPVEINPDKAASWNACMRRDIPELCGCVAIALLPGWEWSKGAKGELAIARLLEMREIYLTEETMEKAA
jgi:DNA-binding CsgD family transcriptional regulator